MSSFKINLENKTLEIKGGIELLYPNEKDYKLYIESIEELAPLLKQINVNRKYESVAEAEKNFEQFLEFLKEHESFLPDLNNFNPIELKGNCISVPFVLAYLQNFYNIVNVDTNILKPELAGREYESMLSLHNKLHTAHCDKRLDFMFSKSVRTLEFPNVDYLNKAIQRIRKFEYIQEFVDIVQGILFCLDYEKEGRGSKIKQALALIDIDINSIKTSTVQSFSEVY